MRNNWSLRLLICVGVWLLQGITVRLLAEAQFPVSQVISMGAFIWATAILIAHGRLLKKAGFSGGAIAWRMIGWLFIYSNLLVLVWKFFPLIGTALLCWRLYQGDTVPNRSDAALVTKYADELARESGMSFAKASAQVRGFLREIHLEMRTEGIADFPAFDLAEAIIGNSPDLSRDVRKYVEVSRRQGVTDADIRWWWGMSETERRLVRKIRMLHQLAYYQNSINRGLNADQAAQEVRRYRPMYGDPRDQTHTEGDDCPLPEELACRVDHYVRRSSLANPTMYRDNLMQATTFNALIRRQIRDGHM